MNRGYNWRNTLNEQATISGTLAGFSITFISLILGWQIADVQIYQGVTFANIAVLFFGLVTSLFIAASGFFLRAKSFDVFNLSKQYREWVEKGSPNLDWDALWIENTNKLRINDRYGRWCHNTAIFMLLMGLFFVVVHYNTVIAFVVTFVGLFIESWQIWKSNGGNHKVHMIKTIIKWEKIEAHFHATKEITTSGILTISVVVCFIEIIAVVMLTSQITDFAKILMEITIAFLGFCGMFAVYLFTAYDNKIDALTDKITDRELELRQLQKLSTGDPKRDKNRQLESETNILNNRKTDIIEEKSKCYRVVFNSFLFLMLSLCFSLLFYGASQLSASYSSWIVLPTIISLIVCLTFGITNTFGLILQIGRANKEEKTVKT
jgi:hypothetical protein